MQEQVNKFNENAMKSDEKIVTKLEEYFDYAKKRQDSIKETLEVTIQDHENRIVALENKTKNKLWSLFEKFKVALVSAIILAMVGLCLKFGGELVKALKEPIQKTIGG